MKVALVTPTMKSGERGGAEALFTGLLGALRASGLDADQVEVVIDESTFDSILDSYARCEALQLDRYDAVISTKAPTYMIRHPRHVSYLVHTIRVFYDMFEREFGAGTREQRRQRSVIHTLDKQGLHPDRVRAHFAIGRTPFERLYDADPAWKDVAFQTLHPPQTLQGFARPRRGEHVLLPSRLHRWKRAALVIEAFKHVKSPIALKVVGTGEDEAALRALAGKDARIEFLGRVSDAELIDLYASALVVPFVPKSEDLGLITLEAFRSRKPVLTCTDSGEPLEFVKDGETGRVTAPDPRAIAEAIDWMAANRGEAKRMGERAHRSIAHITWDRVVSALMEGAARPQNLRTLERENPRTPRFDSAQRAPSDSRGAKVTVLDMQPIEPAVGGGRMRLLGLYHGLGAELPTTYVGSYDWPGEAHRRVEHSPSLEEITVPLSHAHFKEAGVWQHDAAGTNVIDVSFALLGHHSAEYVAAARDAIRHAEIVVFSHPWVYPLVKDAIDRSRQLLVYDAQNVESVLRAQLLGHTPIEARLKRHVAEIERDLCRDADLVMACSHEDRQLFHELYDIPHSKVAIAANGTFTRRAQPADLARRAEAKTALGLPPGPVALFIGSAYGPNTEAAHFISGVLAPKLPNVTFVICGGAGDAIRSAGDSPQNVRLTGVVSDEAITQYLAAADVAINPMFSGSGTNVKMFEFMAAGLPVVTTAAGARGIAQGALPAFRVAEPEGFADAVAALAEAPDAGLALGAAGRRLAEESYSFERISARIGRLLARHRSKLNEPRPRFSVIVATYERHHSLPRLLESLAAQTVKDFEVILVDQSAAAWTGAGSWAQLDIVYVHTDIRGAVKARNTGALFARGDVLAFTDDDCVPAPDWLENAARHFEAPTVVGVEGMITSDKLNDPEYRTVTNVGFEGIGFMTANLLLRRETFCAINGFDERFDLPHFREDTDLAWRAMEHGTIPYGRDVRVFHPAHRRDIAREGHAERNAFFEKDALLFDKHPRRFRQLMAAEGHFRNTREFAGHVRRGAAKYHVNLERDPNLTWLLKSSSVRELLS